MSQQAPEKIIVPRTRDLGDGFEVRRVLPAIERRMVGPFVFFDQMGPLILRAGRGLDVRPHPHIGLATVTYLFQGEIFHRDSLGTAQSILPGAVNWMTAGRGIVHSERTPAPARVEGGPLFGIQSWVALPKRDEETEPGFKHHPPEDLPVIAGEGVTLRLIAGSLNGQRAPVETFSELFYGDVTLAPGARYRLSAEHEERGLYIVEGAVSIGGESRCRGKTLGLPARRAGRDRGGRRGARDGFGRRADGRAAPRLLEFRLELARSHRAGERRLARPPLRPRPRRRQGIHPAAGLARFTAGADRASPEARARALPARAMGCRACAPPRGQHASRRSVPPAAKDGRAFADML